MEININEDELNVFSTQYTELKKKINENRTEYNKIYNQQEIYENEQKQVRTKLCEQDELISKNKQTIYDLKKFYIAGRERGHGFKLFIMLLLSNVAAALIPGAIVPVGVLSLTLFFVDILGFSKKHEKRYLKDFNNLPEYLQLKEKLDAYKIVFNDILNSLNDLNNKVLQCENKLDDLNKQNRDLETQIENLKNDLFEKIIGYEEELEKPLELKRK